MMGEMSRTLDTQYSYFGVLQHTSARGLKWCGDLCICNNKTKVCSVYIYIYVHIYIYYTYMYLVIFSVYHMKTYCTVLFTQTLQEKLTNNSDAWRYVDKQTKKMH